jgi:hypothetical protein
MDPLDHPGRCVKRRVSRRMTATIGGSEVEDVEEIVPAPAGQATGTEA